MSRQLILIIGQYQCDRALLAGLLRPACVVWGYVPVEGGAWVPRARSLNNSGDVRPHRPIKKLAMTGRWVAQLTESTPECPTMRK